MDTQLVGTAHNLQTQGRHRRISFTYDQRGWQTQLHSYLPMPLMLDDTSQLFGRTYRLLLTMPSQTDGGGAYYRQNAVEKPERQGSAGSHLTILACVSVDDTTRQGALRFRVEGTFVAPPTAQATHHELSTLRDAAAKFEESGEIDESVEHLIAVGSSPGGAAPKTWVIGDDGQMWLAKFARISDRGDVSAWEHVATILQRQAGISVQDSRIIRYDPHESIFLTRRFDRHGDTRIPYQSFKTMFRLHDGERKDYATLAREISQISANPPVDGQNSLHVQHSV